MSSIVHRDLDGYYFRVTRNGKVGNYCWSDLTESEMTECIERYDKDALKRFCIGLGKTIREIGDQLDLVCGETQEN